MAVGLDADMGARAIISSITFTVIATIFVVFRWVSRVGVIHNAGADDMLIIGSVV